MGLALGLLFGRGTDSHGIICHPRSSLFLSPSRPRETSDEIRIDGVKIIVITVA